MQTTIKPISRDLWSRIVTRLVKFGDVIADGFYQGTDDHGRVWTFTLHCKAVYCEGTILVPSE